MRLIAFLLCLAGAMRLTSVEAAHALVEQVANGSYVIRDDAGQWGGIVNGITHQNHAAYQAKKILDLSAVPADVWEQTKAVRLSAYFMVRDYSWHDNAKANGLDEAFEIVVNGHVHRYPTNGGAPVFAEGKRPSIAWYDVPLPREEFTRGPNAIVLRKAPSEKNDDYLYLGIDNSTKRGNSFVSFDGETWTQDKLTVPGGNGEYMVRLYLLTKDTRICIRWQPGSPQHLDDPAHLIAYAGPTRLEWPPSALDPLEPITVTGAQQFSWLDETGQLVTNRPVRSSGLVFREPVPPEVIIEASASYHPQPKPINMAPVIAAPKGKPIWRLPVCRVGRDGVRLENSGLRCRFTRGDRLRLVSLYNEYTATEMVADPFAVALFLVEVNGKRYAGSRDFRCVAVKPVRNGFVADLVLAAPPHPDPLPWRGEGNIPAVASPLGGEAGPAADRRLAEAGMGEGSADTALAAMLTATINRQGLRLGLSLRNAGSKPVGFKLAFPHLAGLTVSGQPAEDYYFFPWGGGIIADAAAIIRRGYGDHEAIYQVMDLFSPARGGGLYVRTDDAAGWHKTLALRKHVPGATDINAEGTHVDTAEEYKWTNPLDEVPGIGFAYEYLRRTREPGETFAPASAVLSAHPGDWHVAMKAYADWAHKVWKFRPYPSRFRNVHNMIAAGWGQSVLFRDGKYRTDFIQPATDCIELMSWWEWSRLGPWRTPLDKGKVVLGEAKYREWEPYFVKDPVTGEMMWNNQPGDYDGYNERFGGLPSFRKAIQTYKDMGALVTLYTDPIRCSDTSKFGQQHGKPWGVVRSNGEHVKSYDVWNMCHDVAAYRQWVANTMKRVMRETGADGIRLDEYGHKGWACFSTLHQHSFAERGVSQWQKAIAETCRLVRTAMDEVAPSSVLTTEHPGYDYELQFLEGCITYDLTVQATPLRPLECNLQRFYFPECQAYELDHRHADPQHKKRFWNGVASFGSYYPPAMYRIRKEHADIFNSRDCEALIPTLTPYVYANRFTSDNKTIYTIYNATGHTFDGPVLAMKLRPDEHLFDLLHCRLVPVVHDRVHLYLERAGVACLIRLPKRRPVVCGGDSQP